MMSSRNASDDIFELAFAAMRQSVSAMQSLATASSETLAMPKEHRELDELNGRLCHSMLKATNTAASLQLHSRQETHVLIEARLSQSRQLHSSAVKQIDCTLQRMMSSCLQQRDLITMRLNQQYNVSERRLQDLVFEVIGEYGKALLRAQRREDYLRRSHNIDVVISTWQMIWNRFLMRFKLDLYRHNINELRKSKVRFTALNMKTDKLEVEALLKSMSKKLSMISDQSFAVQAIIRITKGEPQIRSAAKSTNRDRSRNSSSTVSQAPIRLAYYRRELCAIFEELRQWIGSPTSLTRARTGIPRKMSDDRLIDNCSFAWQSQNICPPGLSDQLLPPIDTKCSPIESLSRSLRCQYGLSLLNSHVYFCLEERSMLDALGLLTSDADYQSRSLDSSFGVKKSSGVLLALQELYCDFPHTNITLQSRSQDSLKSEHLSPVQMLMSLRQTLYTHPLKVLRNENKHFFAERMKFPFSGALRNDVQLLRELSRFPEVICAQSLHDGTVLHFACVSIHVLKESLFCSSEHNRIGLFTALKYFLPEKCASALPSRSQSLTSAFFTENDGRTSQISQPDSSKIELNLIVSPINSSCSQSLLEYYFPTRESSEIDSHDSVWSSISILPDALRSVGTCASRCAWSPNAVTHGQDKLRSVYALFFDDSGTCHLSPDDQKSITDSSDGVFYVVQLLPWGGQQIDELRRAGNERVLDVETESSVYDDDHFEASSPRRFQTHPLSDDHSQSDSRLLHDCLTIHSQQSLLLRAMENKITASRDDDSITVSEKKVSWDVNILSHVCPWRSCLCESQGNRAQSNCGGGQATFPINLCPFHQELQVFLDSKSTLTNSKGVLESSKYLPKKAPSLSMHGDKRDLLMIRAASTLLQELFDGRLKSTVKMFSKKMINEIKLRTSYETQVNLFLKYYGVLLAKRRRKHNQSIAISDLTSTLVPPAPTWVLWQNQDYLDKTRNGQMLSLEMLQYILASEQLVSREVSALRSLQCFPSQEVGLIRRDFKMFKERQEQLLLDVQSKDDISNADKARKPDGNDLSSIEGYDHLVGILQEESKLTEKKYELLSKRRENEEEARVQLLRKLAKMKVVEENQSRDPSNFRNQSGRY